jgi:hypothetical protein
MNEFHPLTVESNRGTDVVYVCSEPGCGRRVAVNRSGEIVVVVKGDFYALHASDTVGLQIGITAPSRTSSA